MAVSGMFPHTVTVWNKYAEGRTEKWQRTVLTGVSFSISAGQRVNTHAVNVDNNTRCIIPAKLDGYVKPKAFAALDDKSGKWTLTGGDTLALGEIMQDVVSSDRELQALDDVFTIEKVESFCYGANLDCLDVICK